MPRKGRGVQRRARKKRRQQGSFIAGGGADGILRRVRFRDVLFSSVTSTGFSAFALNVSPLNFGDVLNKVALQYEFFRFRSFTIRTVPPIVGFPTGAGGPCLSLVHGISWNPEVQRSSLPGGFSSMSQDPLFAMGPGTRAASITCKNVAALGPQKWYRVNNTGTPTAEDGFQGVFTWATYTDSSSTGSFRLWVEIEGQVDFMGTVEDTIEFARPDVEVKHVVYPVRFLGNVPPDEKDDARTHTSLDEEVLASADLADVVKQKKRSIALNQDPLPDRDLLARVAALEQTYDERERERARLARESTPTPSAPGWVTKM